MDSPVRAAETYRLFFERSSPQPTWVVDRETLREIKAHADLRRIPAVVLTTSRADE
jgi:hypothetical protein